MTDKATMDDDKEAPPERPATVKTDKAPTPLPADSPRAARGGNAKFPLINDTQEKEDTFDLVAARNLQQPTGLIGTIAYMVKGALGAGILGAHAAFASAGLIAIPLTLMLAVYMGTCLTLLVRSAQVIYKRTELTKMTYSDVGEAAFTLSKNSKVRRMAKPVRYFIDVCVCMDLLGACCCYQLMMSGTIKQIIENTQATSIRGAKGYPNLRIYLLCMWVPVVLMCLVKRLDILAKFSIVGNVLIGMCVIATIYYSVQANPSMSGMKVVTNIKGVFTFVGMVAFSMSCCGIVVSLECNMKNPKKLPIAMGVGFAWISGFVITIAVFGYSAYGEMSKTPITVHFPMTWFPITLKMAIFLMLFITHAVNFWVPFNMIFHYIKPRHKQEKWNFWEYVYRVILCTMCTLLGIAFPSVNKLMSFIGAFAISNMGFIFPTLIWLVTSWERPGLGPGKWRLIVGIIVIIGGLIVFIAGTVVSFKDLLTLFTGNEEWQDESEHSDNNELDYGNTIRDDDVT